MKKYLNLILSIAFFYQLMIAQEKPELLTGSLNQDSDIAFRTLRLSQDEQLDGTPAKPRSPLLSGVLSFVLPGAGQFYNEDYWKTAIFLAVEAGAIAAAVIYDNKGDNQTNFYEDYANQHWSPSRYARWTLYNLESLNSAVFNDPDKLSYYNNNLFYDNQQTQVNWNVLNQLESDIGGYYSHRLERYGEQQYYEMIGKYPQFNVGWDDFGDENTPFKYGDPVTGKFKYYSEERGKANDYYSVAKTAVIIVVTNHILSALEAAWSTSRYNKSLSVNVGLESENFGYFVEYYPTLNFRYNF